MWALEAEWGYQPSALDRTGMREAESPPYGLEKAGVEKVDLSALHNLGVAIAGKSSLGAKALS